MEKTKILVWSKVRWANAIQFIIFMGIVIAAPYFLNQAITGPLVNAMLFLATIFLGARSAILIGLTPSLVSISTGLLPLPLAPMIPFIMVGNTLLILSFDLLRKKNYWLGMLSASAIKFLFLFSMASIVTSLILKDAIAVQAAKMLGLPQLLTALAGGILAYLFLKVIKKV